MTDKITFSSRYAVRSSVARRQRKAFFKGLSRENDPNDSCAACKSYCC
jgi:hypothetical protein